MTQTVSCPFCKETKTITPYRVTILNRSYNVYKCPTCSTTLASIDIEQNKRNSEIDEYIKRQQELMNINPKESQH